MKERTQFIARLIITHLVLVGAAGISSCFIINDGFMATAVSQALLMIVFFTGYWEFFFKGFRWYFLGMMEIPIVISIIRKISEPSVSSSNIYWVSGLAVVLLFLIYQLITIIIVILKKETENFELVFPFKEGTYLVTDGGNSKISRIMNYHYHSIAHKKGGTNNSMKFAADIVRIDNRLKTFFPMKNEDYSIYGIELLASMSGTIVKVINDIDDNKPYIGKYPYNTGNTVVIKNQNYYLLLGHLKKGSITVKEGDVVSAGEIIANIGNSGMSERPHLHMQLMKSDDGYYWGGSGISLMYRNINLYKNRIIKL